MSVQQWWSLGMVAYGVTGMWIAGSKRTLGWWMGLSAQVLWVGFAYVTGLWAFYLSAVAYGSTFGRNILRWRYGTADPRTLWRRWRRRELVRADDWTVAP